MSAAAKKLTPRQYQLYVGEYSGRTLLDLGKEAIRLSESVRALAMKYDAQGVPCIPGYVPAQMAELVDRYKATVAAMREAFHLRTGATIDIFEAVSPDQEGS